MNDAHGSVRHEWKEFWRGLRGIVRNAFRHNDGPGYWLIAAVIYTGTVVYLALC